MPQGQRPNQFGRIFAPDEAWLAHRPPEPILDADLPIIDTHHHLWIRDGHRYLLDDYLADVATGHNLLASVFLQCHSMYRSDGPQEMRPIGETEFVNGVAAMSASGRFGTPRVAAGIVGYADLTLGDRVEPIWKRISVPAADGFAACAIPAITIPTRSSATAPPSRSATCAPRSAPAWHG